MSFIEVEITGYFITESIQTVLKYLLIQDKTVHVIGLAGGPEGLQRAAPGPRVWRPLVGFEYK